MLGESLNSDAILWMGVGKNRGSVTSEKRNEKEL